MTLAERLDVAAELLAPELQGWRTSLAGISGDTLSRADLQVSDALRGSPHALLGKRDAARVRAQAEAIVHTCEGA